MNFLEHIDINPKIMMGKPVIKGTRITIKQIPDELSSSDSLDDILKAHPHITKEQVHTALAFAAQSIRGDEIYPITA